eukprot:Hpha_TRINITY_DN17081_c0_g1::TRINITY_DN17081_c0_g1_i1::g.166251::m.166251
MAGCCDWLSGLLLRKSDTPENVKIKRMMTAPIVFIFFFSLGGLLSNMSSSRLIYVVTCCVMVLITIVFLIGGALNVLRTRYLVDIFLVVTAFSICLQDASASAFSASFRPWAYAVLLLDVALVVGRHHIPFIIIPTVLSYLFAETIESTHKFGLYAVGSWGAEAGESFCNC